MDLTEQFDRLARFEPAPYPVVSLYLDATAGQHGRDQFQTFVRKELRARADTYAAGSGERESLDKDLERISAYLANDLQPSANGVAIFACNAGELFEALQLDAPAGENSLFIGDQPHLYPLARLISQQPRYAAVIADTHRARILVVAQGAVENAQTIEGVKTRRTSQGGWSQARYQRHLSNYHLQHVKEVVDALDRIVQRERLAAILIAGDPVVIPMFRDQLPKHLAEKVVDEMTLSTDAPEHEVLRASYEALQRLNETSDRERVDAALGAYRAGGLGVVGPDETLLALTNGQVDELLITASLANLSGLRGTRAAQMALANDAGFAESAVEPAAAGEAERADIGTVRLADELVSKAQQTGARITFIEDSSLLERYGGTAALLRYRI
ncbi:MAG TPA: Vms1/Ankzf1 family peptidyl-tRNA hydrolase [Vicinamibacterales bacterium]|jgi:peptide chain release factor subunit 1|nr:Vms1/Ankzf1 family peptidyl-tRNA hydrolase [Vicinamibacterales bacterium]